MSVLAWNALDLFHLKSTIRHVKSLDDVMESRSEALILVQTCRKTILKQSDLGSWILIRNLVTNM